MKNFRFLIFFFLITISLSAQELKDIVYVEDLNSSQKMLKDEFLNLDTKAYTLVVGFLQSNNENPINFFRKYKLTNAIAYKYGKNKQYIRILSGVYPDYKEAKEDIKLLPKELLKLEPYPSKIIYHQKMFNKNKQLKKAVSVRKTEPTAIFTSNEKLKAELLKQNPKYYSISLASFDYSSKEDIENFFKNNGISKEALAHLYGKDKSRVRVILGLYDSYNEALKGIDNLSGDLKANSPFVQRVKTIQNFYKKYNSLDDENIVQLKVSKKNNDEKNNTIKPKISKEIKVVKKIEPPVVTFVKKETKKEEAPKEKAKKVEVKKEQKKQEVKKQEPKPIKTKFLKESKNKDVYYVEPEGSLNILNEVFLNEESSFYTIDLGTLKVEETPIDKLFIQYNLSNNALAYRYGDKKEYAKVVYGAYETKKDAQETLEELNRLGYDSQIKVSNIQEHQKLYKQYHESIIKDEVLPKEKVAKYISVSDFISFGENNSLKEAFFNKDSGVYTITLITFDKEDIDLYEFLENNGLDKEDLVAYSLGTNNNYYRVFYKAFNSSKKTLEEIERLSDKLKANKPYVSKVITNIRKFEKYNNRDILEAIKNGQIIK